MININSTERIPIKMWVSDLEESAIKQAENLANLPFAFKHVALMPDAHCGYGMPIGGVLATLGVVVPNAVGVDIGCGMCAVKTNIEDLDSESLKKIMSGIQSRIPLGFSKHAQAQNEKLMPEVESVPEVIKNHYQNALYQLGSLGGGNHFIEIQYGSDNCIWVMIHSGSRNLGKQVADYYNKLAKNLNSRWHSQVPSNWDLAFLPIESQEAKEYIKAMQYCVDFAFANRKLMMERVQEAFKRVLSEPLEFSEIINIAHNYAAWEHHFGKDVIVHRKGATSAREGEIGIIPGSQGTKSYIVEGLGNPQSFHSCSHGAGRKMGRKQAQRELDLQEEINRLDKKGILHAIRGQKDLDEAAGAYKDIHQVMENQKDLVKIRVELEPLAVVKG
ncbi:RtcB family protein [Marinifilum fragile]|uniref:RtcB family protein n=1 Tax=Marinifilum fragile TaxID=570161 RepID=UPI0006D1A215|nr:RtcB family protein [Marinifilum fragile]